MVCCTLVLMVPAVFLLVEVLAAVFLPDREASLAREVCTDFSFKVIIPAHNEELIIGRSLISLLSQVDAGRVLVVADNCTDRTAEIVRGFGVEVLERMSCGQRGKGYALDYAIDHLKNHATDVLVFMDADCTVRAGKLSQLAALAFRLERPVQAVNIQTGSDGSSISGCVSELAMLFKNFIRPLGLQKMGMPCLLTGTGMAIPWHAVEAVNLASGNIVEDLQMGIDFVCAGLDPFYAEEVIVISDAPGAADCFQEQRRRWEHGHLLTIRQQVPRLLKMAIKQRRLTNFILALELGIPPITSYTYLLLVFIVLAIILVMATGEVHALTIGVVPLCVLAIALLLGWIKYGMKVLPIWSIMRIPFFMIWKIPVYLRFFVCPEKKWKRTGRVGKSKM